MDIIEALADCIMRFEGWFPPGSTTSPRGSTSWRNRNPGNLRPFDDSQARDEKGYRTFESFNIGWGALTNDIRAKLNGSHGLTPTSTLHDFFNIYAPALDQNDPQQYSRQIALWLSKIYNAQITPDWTLQQLQSLS